MKLLGRALACGAGAAHTVIWLVWLRQLALVFDGTARTAIWYCSAASR